MNERNNINMFVLLLNLGSFFLNKKSIKDQKIVKL